MAHAQKAFTQRVDASPEAIFALLSDLPHYHAWLPGSESFGSTSEVVPYPVQLGTTYLDTGNLGSRRGSVTEFEPSRSLGFHQTMPIKRGPLAGNADIRIRYTFEPQGDATIVTRNVDLTLDLKGIAKLFSSLVIRAFMAENKRVIAELQRHYG